MTKNAAPPTSSKSGATRPTIQGRQIAGCFAALLAVCLVVLVGLRVQAMREASAWAARMAEIEEREEEARTQWSVAAGDHEVFATDQDLAACVLGTGLSTEAWGGTFGGTRGMPAVVIAGDRVTVQDPTSPFAGRFCLARRLSTGPGRFRALHFERATQGVSVVFLEITTSHEGLTLWIVPVANPTDDMRLGPLRRHDVAHMDEVPARAGPP